MRSLFLALIFAAFHSVSAIAADSFASDWAASSKSRARLIADGAGGAGFEIELAPGAITYWRDPGESGAPPTFDFSGSRNVADAEVLFPAPSRILEPDGSTANGYRDATVFPIRIAFADPTKPAVLKLNANYAVCEKICLPAKALLTLELPTGMSGLHSAALIAAMARVPKKAAFGTLGGEIGSLGPAKWRLCFKAAVGAAPELFLEPPRGAWLDLAASDTEPGRRCYELSLKEAPLDPNAPLTVDATLTSEAGAQETSFELPVH
jgi:DsbC/DsbD-like thiol-disulfide interchange protein